VDPTARSGLQADPRLRHSASRGISSFAISAGGDRIITTGTTDRHASIWLLDPSNPNVISFAKWGLTTRGPLGVQYGAFGNNDSNVALLGDDGIHVWSVATPAGGIYISNATLTAAALDHRQPRVVVGGSDGVLTIYTLTPTGAQNPIVLRGHASRVWDVSFSADGSQIVSASADNTVRLWWANEVEIPGEFKSLLDTARNRLPITLTTANRESYLEQQ
jgi:WD40 repeat protein